MNEGPVRWPPRRVPSPVLLARRAVRFLAWYGRQPAGWNENVAIILDLFGIYDALANGFAAGLSDALTALCFLLIAVVRAIGRWQREPGPPPGGGRYQVYDRHDIWKGWWH